MHQIKIIILLIFFLLFPLKCWPKITVKPISSALVIKLSSFRESDMQTQLMAQLRPYLHQPFKTLIIDLRNNNGGFIHQAIAVSAMFVTNSPLIQLQSTANNIITVTRPTNHTHIPSQHLIILINSNTASAAEAAAYILHQHPNAKIIGTPSHGKTTVSSSSINQTPYKQILLPSGNIHPTHRFKFHHPNTINDNEILRLLRKLDKHSTDHIIKSS